MTLPMLMRLLKSYRRLYGATCHLDGPDTTDTCHGNLIIKYQQLPYLLINDYPNILGYPGYWVIQKSLDFGIIRFPR